MPNIEIREHLDWSNYKTRSYSKGAQTVNRSVYTHIHLPERSGRYRTPVGYVVVDLEGVVPQDDYKRESDQPASLLILEGKVVKGRVEISLINNKGYIRLDPRTILEASINPTSKDLANPLPYRARGEWRGAGWGAI